MFLMNSWMRTQRSLEMKWCVLVLSKHINRQWCFYLSFLLLFSWKPHLLNERCSFSLCSRMRRRGTNLILIQPVANPGSWLNLTEVISASQNSWVEKQPKMHRSVSNCWVLVAVTHWVPWLFIKQHSHSKSWWIYRCPPWLTSITLA